MASQASTNENIIVRRVSISPEAKLFNTYVSKPPTEDNNKVYYFHSNIQVTDLQLESYETYPATVDKNFVLLTWKNIKYAGSKEQKTQFYNLRKKIYNLLKSTINCADSEACNYKQIAWYEIGSQSLDSDLDISLVPDISYLFVSSSLSNVYESIYNLYGSYFTIPMDIMFDMNFYATPFFYEGKLTNIPNNFFVEVNKNKPEIKQRVSTNGSSPIEISPKSFSKGYIDPEVTSVFKEAQNVHTLIDRCMYYIFLTNDEIYDNQYKYACIGLPNDTNLIWNQFSPTTETEQSYVQLIEKYETNIKSVIDEQNQTISRSDCVELLSQSTLHLNEAYHTLGTMLHVNCKDEFKKDCYQKMLPEHFVCSVFENLSYSLTKLKIQQVAKASKYIARCCEALLYVYVKVGFGCSNMPDSLPEKWFSLHAIAPPCSQVCVNYNAIYEIFKKADYVNKIRKGEVSGNLSDEISVLTNIVADGKFTEFVNRMLTQLSNKLLKFETIQNSCDFSRVPSSRSMTRKTAWGEPRLSQVPKQVSPIAANTPIAPNTPIAHNTPSIPSRNRRLKPLYTDIVNNNLSASKNLNSSKTNVQK